MSDPTRSAPPHGPQAAPPPSGHAPNRLALFAPIAAATLTGYALSMSIPFFSLSLRDMGAENLTIGVNAAAPAVAMILGVPLMPALMRRLGPAAFLTLAAGLIAVSMLPLRLVPDPASWTALRFVHGFGVAAAFYGSELWIVSAAPPARRGLWIGIYGLVLSLGFLAGPVSLQFMDLSGWAPPLSAAGLALLACIPILAARRAAPGGLGAPVSIRGALGFLRSDPSVMACVAAFGAAETGAFALLPVWAATVGMGEDAALRLAALVAAGNVLLQAPLGWGADRLPRRAMLLAAALTTTLCAGLIAAIAADGPLLWATAATLGGMAVALYSVSLAELGARYEGARLSQATAAFMSCYGIGALVAPPAMGAMADALPPHGMLWVLGAIGLLTAAVIAGRAGKRRPGA